MSVNINSYIDYLNSLNNISASGGNALAESQALNKYFPEVYEPFPIVESIYELLAQENKVIILTGHAGDGKSTVALDVYKKLKNIAPENIISETLKEVEIIPEHNVGIIKDMSELSIQQRETYLTQAFSDDSKSWLIISNTGPLLSSFVKFSETQNISIDSVLLKVLNTPIENTLTDEHKINLFDKELTVVNLTKLDNVELSTKVLGNLINHSGWEGCNNCVIVNKCPIKKNHSSIKKRLPELQIRLKYLYLLISNYESRLTLRQIIAQLSFSLTGGRKCNNYNYLDGYDIDKDAQLINAELGKILFSELFFGFSDRDESHFIENIHAIKLTRKMNYGGPQGPIVEKKIQDELVFGWAKVPETLKPLMKEWQSKAKGHDSLLIRESLRRASFIFGEKSDEPVNENKFVSQFLHSKTIIDFESWVTCGELNLSSRNRRRFKDSCMKVFLESFTGFSANQFKEQDKIFLTMKRPCNRILQPTQIIIESLPFKDFELQFNSLKRIPEINFQKGRVIMPLNLPLIDYIRSISEGEIGNDLSPIHKGKFDWFNSELLRATSDERKDVEELELLRSGIDGEVKVHKFILDEEDNKLELN
tara:strand:+ start:9169 stop:10947 length:1779 start_codon:yes stop_codon:yes gene_type:complete